MLPGACEEHGRETGHLWCSGQTSSSPVICRALSSFRFNHLERGTAEDETQGFTAPGSWLHYSLVIAEGFLCAEGLPLKALRVPGIDAPWAIQVQLHHPWAGGQNTEVMCSSEVVGACFHGNRAASIKWK